MKYFSITGHLSSSHGISASIQAESRADAIKKFLKKFPKGTIDFISPKEIYVVEEMKELIRFQDVDHATRTTHPVGCICIDCSR